ncbi:MAG: hypothetical protein JWO72_2664 [Caulobacteraceae bacterium]|nr:hypothetical protein [Caulobacteraceae bacterium]
MPSETSEKSVAERLQVKGDRRIAVLNAPLAVSDALGAERPTTPAEEAEVVVLFVADRAEFDLLLPDAARAVKPGAILWLAYPKLTSSLAGDLNRDVIHRLGLAMGFKTVSQIAVDNDWSAMRLKPLA